MRVFRMWSTRCRFFSSGSQIVRRSKTVCVNSAKGYMVNICVKSVGIWTSSSGDVQIFKKNFLALVAILINIVNPFEFW